MEKAVGFFLVKVLAGLFLEALSKSYSNHLCWLLVAAGNSLLTDKPLWSLPFSYHFLIFSLPHISKSSFEDNNHLIRTHSYNPEWFHFEIFSFISTKPLFATKVVLRFLDISVRENSATFFNVYHPSTLPHSLEIEPRYTRLLNYSLSNFRFEKRAWMNCLDWPWICILFWLLK